VYHDSTCSMGYLTINIRIWRILRETLRAATSANGNYRTAEYIHIHTDNRDTHCVQKVTAGG